MSIDTTVTPPRQALRFACPQCHAPFDPEHGDGRCGACGFTTSRAGEILSFVPRNSSDEWRKFFEGKATAPDGDTTRAVAYSFSIQHRYIVDGFRKLCDGLPASALILDVGCGNGLFWQALFPDRPVIGVDYSLGMCRLAKAHGMQVYQADGRALPFAENQFDLIYSAEILQYVDDLPALMRDLGRLCRPGGRIVVSTLNGTSMLRRGYRALRRLIPRRHAPMHSALVMRSAAEMVAAGESAQLQLGDICRTHFPFPWEYRSKRQDYLFEPLTTNLIVQFIKPLS